MKTAYAVATFVSLVAALHVSLAPQHVKGPEANAVFKELARQTQEPQWNFNKYLVAADGRVAQYFDSQVAPDSRRFNEAVEKLLK